MLQKKQMPTEDGFALVSAMVLLMILVLLGIGSMNSSYFENMIATNDKIIKQELYNQENCLDESKVKYREWLTTAYLTTSETTAHYPPVGGIDSNGDGVDDNVCLDKNGNAIGSFKVRNVESSGTAINGWDDIALYNGVPADHPANTFPPQNHIDKPIPGTGYDEASFVIRRFVGTSYSADNDKNITVQQGFYKAFNKY